jgi:hypothetical protein
MVKLLITPLKNESLKNFPMLNATSYIRNSHGDVYNIFNTTKYPGGQD